MRRWATQCQSESGLTLPLPWKKKQTNNNCVSMENLNQNQPHCETTMFPILSRRKEKFRWPICKGENAPFLSLYNSDQSHQPSWHHENTHILHLPNAARKLSHCILNKHTKLNQKVNTRPLLTEVCIYRNPVTKSNLNLDHLETTQSKFPKFTLIIQQTQRPRALLAMWWSLKEPLSHEKYF